MVIFGHEVPDIAVVKVAAFAVLGLLLGIYEVRRQKAKAQPPTHNSSEPIQGAEKHMGMVDEVKPERRLP